jgi:hypothetical protein
VSFAKVARGNDNPGCALAVSAMLIVVAGDLVRSNFETEYLLVVTFNARLLRDRRLAIQQKVGRQARMTRDHMSAIQSISISLPDIEHLQTSIPPKATP